MAAAIFGKLTGLGFEKPVKKFFRTQPGEKSLTRLIFISGWTQFRLSQCHAFFFFSLSWVAHNTRLRVTDKI